MSDTLTCDDFLGGRIALFQHKNGYRVTMDSVLLAAGVPAVAGERVLDMGCGSGAAALCLAARVHGVHVTGLELQPALAVLARKNVAANGLTARVTIIDGDVDSPPAGLLARQFDHVMVNPPYVRAGRGTVPPDPIKAMARIESHAPLPVWISLSARALGPTGTLTLVHRSDRGDEIAALMAEFFGDLVVFPLWPGPERSRPCKRIIVQGTRNRAQNLTTAPGLVIHTRDGGYTDRAGRILREGDAMAVGIPHR